MATIGKTTIGSGATNEVNDSKFVSGPYSFPGGTIEKATIYRSGGSGFDQSKAIVYANSGGSPGVLLAVSIAVGVGGGSGAAWVDWDFSPDVVVSAQNIWIGWHNRGNEIIYYYDNGTSLDFKGQGSGDDNYDDGTSDPFGSIVFTTSGREFSVYLTYTPGGGGGSVGDIVVPHRNIRDVRLRR